MKANPHTQHIPIIMITALDQLEDRVRGLEAGADDFLTKPVNDVALFCRIKSLVRLKMLSDELRTRAVSSESMGLLLRPDTGTDIKPGRILVIDTRQQFMDRVKAAVGNKHHVTKAPDPATAGSYIAEETAGFDLIIVSLDNDEFDGLRICSQLKSLEQTRQVPVLVIVNSDDQQRLLRALDMGVNDYLIRPVDRQELLARVNTQVRRSRYAEQLRLSVQTTIEMAVTDALTGLHNRRYMETHLSQLAEHAADRGKPLSILSLDVDYFKAINDTYGHDVGDKVLQEIAKRLRDSVRGVDMACRVGGEEFIIILPSTDRGIAHTVAERIRKSISNTPLDLGLVSGPLRISVSVGISTLEDPRDKMEDLLRRADQALYSAKRAGRNRVVFLAA